MTSETVEIEEAWMRVEFASHTDAIIDFARAIDALDVLVNGPSRVELLHAESPPSTWTEQLFQARDELKGRATALGDHFGKPFAYALLGDELGILPAPYQLMMQRFANSFFQNTVKSLYPAVFRELFAFAGMRRLERQSPILLEVVVLVGGSVLLGPTLVWALMRAVLAYRERELHLELLGSQRDAYSDFARQQRAKAVILEKVAETLADPRYGRISIPNGMLESLGNVAAPAVAELGTRSLVEKITVGISSGS